MIEKKPIEHTPFVAVRMDKNWYVTLGKYKVTRELESYEACVALANDTTWDLLMSVMQALIQQNLEDYTAAAEESARKLAIDNGSKKQII